jgi:hypothetical protein
MVVWLRETLDAARRDAEAAGGGEWSVEDARLVDIRGGQLVETAREPGTLVVGDGRRIVTGTSAVLPHIAANNPSAVLRRITADRKMLDALLAKRHNVVDDPAYTCPAATNEHDGGQNYDTGPCNCGRDEWAARYVRLLAEGWGWTPEETTTQNPQLQLDSSPVPKP